MIFRPPQLTSGKPENAVENRALASVGSIEDARLRGTAVTLAAGQRKRRQCG